MDDNQWTIMARSLIGWLVRNYGMRREDAEDAAQQAWIKVREDPNIHWGIVKNAGKQAAIDIMRRAYFKYERQLQSLTSEEPPESDTRQELTWDLLPAKQDVEHDVLAREELAAAIDACPVAWQTVLGHTDEMNANTRKVVTWRERRAFHAAWNRAPVRCSHCGRVYRVDPADPNQDIPDCNCPT